MSMDVGSKKKGPNASPNITPYIDILLVLLIIFMVVSPSQQMDLEVKVPQPPPPGQQAQADPSVIVVSMDERLTLKVNADPVTMDTLGAKLLDIYKARANKNMFVSASSKLLYGDVVKIIDIAKGNGVGDIGLITEIN
jgi:biopolymer transport protein ExbD